MEMLSSKAKPLAAGIPLQQPFFKLDLKDFTKSIPSQFLTVARNLGFQNNKNLIISIETTILQAERR
jgi:hypothetical protein